MIGDGGPILKSMISSTGGILSVSQQEELFVQGKAFSWEERLTFAADGVQVIVFDPALFLGEQIVINPIISYATAGPILIDFYTGTTANDDGTVLMASNRREGFPAPKSVLRKDPTGIVLGTSFSGDLVPASGAGVGNTNGAANAQNLPFEIDISAGKKAIRIENEDGAGTLVQIKLTWFEI